MALISSHERITPMEDIWTCGTIQITRAIIKILRISVKSPIERIIRGRLKRVAIGLTMALTRDMTKPAAG